MIHGIFVKKLSINKELNKTRKYKFENQLMIYVKLLLFLQRYFHFSKWVILINNISLVLYYSEILCVILHCYNSITGAVLCNAHGQCDQIFAKVGDGHLRQ